jgi:hypothetical protein
MKRIKSVFLGLIVGIILLPVTTVLANVLLSVSISTFGSWGVNVFFVFFFAVVQFGIPFIVAIKVYNYFLKKQ